MSEKCAVSRYTCPANAKRIKELAYVADAQQATNAGFAKDIYPWKSLCDNGKYLHYVARDATGIICGWLTATIKQFEDQTYIYLVEIGTRRIKDSLYGGIGHKLHSALLVDALRLGCEFIYLYPLDAAVTELYKRPEWSYIQLRPDIPYLFRLLTGTPSAKLLATLANAGPMDILLRAKEIANEGTKNIGLLKRIDDASAIVHDKDALNELDQHMDYMEMLELPLQTQRAELWSFFSKYLSKVR